MLSAQWEWIASEVCDHRTMRAAVLCNAAGRPTIDVANGTCALLIFELVGESHDHASRFARGTWSDGIGNVMSATITSEAVKGVRRSLPPLSHSTTER